MADTATRAKLVSGLLTRLVDALGRGNEEGALQILSESIAGGLDGRAIYLELFQPALEQIGHQWEAGRICVAEEH